MPFSNVFVVHYRKIRGKSKFGIQILGLGSLLQFFYIFYSFLGLFLEKIFEMNIKVSFGKKKGGVK